MKIQLIIGIFLTILGSVNAENMTRLFPDVEEYNKILPETEYVEPRHLQVGILSKSEELQRKDFLKKIGLEFLNSDEIPLLLKESRYLVAGEKYFYLILLTTRALYSFEYFINSNHKGNNGVYKKSAFELTDDEINQYKELLQKTNKLSGTFKEEGYVTRTRVWFITIWDKEQKRHTFAVPRLSIFPAVDNDPPYYYPTAKEYKPIITLNDLLTKKRLAGK